MDGFGTRSGWRPLPVCDLSTAPYELKAREPTKIILIEHFVVDDRTITGNDPRHIDSHRVGETEHHAWCAGRDLVAERRGEQLNEIAAQECVPRPCPLGGNR